MAANNDTTTSTSKLFTRAEVAKHSETSKDTWIIIHNNVYNVTPFLNEVALFPPTKKNLDADLYRIP